MRHLMLGGLLYLAAAGAAEPRRWDDPGRAAAVAALAPGRGLPALSPETLFAAWTAEQVQRWQAAHPPLPPEEAWQRYVAAAPADAELVADFPTHIAPFGRLRSGQPEPFKRDDVLIAWCPFCGSRTFSLRFDPAHPQHATATCCGTELYGANWPADYALKPNSTARFRHLDDQLVEVPCTLYRDREGVEWELFIGTIFAQRRWLQVGCELVARLGRQFQETGDPLNAHKIAVLLDRVADTYYGLPLTYRNELCGGEDGLGLTRAAWEAVPRPAIFEVGALGPWNRRTPIFNRGWINMSDELIWVEPFALVRHHPAFRDYSQRTYGDLDALDRKVRSRLLRELSLMFKSVFAQKLLTNYQEANYVQLWLLGVLLQDSELLDFAGPAQEVALYNHTYPDGLNGEGAPNYMAMPGGYFYPYLSDPKGWLRFYPKFLEEHPFYHAAAGEMKKLDTLRGLQLEFGDQHQYAYAGLLTEPALIREREQRGSRNWAGYGVGLLRVGGPGHRQEVGLTYTRATLHNASDALGLECWFDGVPVMRRGGYAASWHNAPLQWERPEYQALRAMGLPYELEEGPRGFGTWTWNYAHSPICQNTVTIDNQASGAGWGDNRGYGEVVTFKGGEAAGAPGAGFQVLDVRDHYTWQRVGLDVPEFRRTLIGVEGPDGRPYVVDLVKLTGGRSHALHQSAVAERAAASLPATVGRADDLAAALLDGRQAESPHHRDLQRVRQVERAPAPETWSVTWRTDAARYAPRPIEGAWQRPLDEPVGRVRLTLTGLGGAGATDLLSAKGPWVGWLKQPLPNNQRIDGNVAFVGARDFLVEHRVATGNEPLSSLFVHVLEGHREGETPAVQAVERLAVDSTAGAPRDLVALRLRFATHTDTLVYQSAPGAVRLPDGLTTDARYALLRRAENGEVLAAEGCRGSYLTAGEFSLAAAGDFTGTIDDVVGDLTGTRRESALIITPRGPWPTGDSLRDRQLLVRLESALRTPGNEGYRVAETTALPDGRVRIDLQDHVPFAVSWHQVTALPPDRPNVIRTYRPMVDYGNTPWYHGLKLWLPARNQTYTIKRVNEVGGGYGGDTVELVEPVNLAAEGIKPGDWYVIYGIQPGLEVTVANDFCWRKEPARDWRQYTLAGTGDLAVTMADGRTSFPAAETARGATWIADRPAWLELTDDTAPKATRLLLDGQPITAEAARDLGAIEPPRRWIIDLADAENPLDLAALNLSYNGQRLPAGSYAVVPTADGREATLTIDLEPTLRGHLDRPRRHRFELSIAERAVTPHPVRLLLSFVNRVPLEANATYLSDLKPVRAAAHGGLQLDRDYRGNPISFGGAVYAKGLTLCPAVASGGTAEVVYELPRAGLVLQADVGISDSSAGNGSATFVVETAPSAEGPWTALFTSPILRGGQPPIAVKTALGAARHLRLRTTDAGDNINSDHAVWADARLKPAD